MLFKPSAVSIMLWNGWASLCLACEGGLAIRYFFLDFWLMKFSPKHFVFCQIGLDVVSQENARDTQAHSGECEDQFPHNNTWSQMCFRPL